MKQENIIQSNKCQANKSNKSNQINPKTAPKNGDLWVTWQGNKYNHLKAAQCAIREQKETTEQTHKNNV